MIEQSLPLSEKYRPSKLSEVFGQEHAKLVILDFIQNFKKQKKKALLLYGSTGSGKTALVYAAASDLGSEVVELNASDFRNKEQIQEIVGKALEQKSLFSKGKIIFIDELEGVTGWYDRGGLQELVRLIENAKFPVIMICDDPWQDKLKPIRNKAQKVELKALDRSVIIKILIKIAKKEGFSIDEIVFGKIADISEGDARAAINDLQILTSSNKQILEKDVALLGFRERETEIFEALRRVLKTREALYAFDNVDLEPDKIILWLDENLPLEYQGKELERAYDVLSLADVYKTRIIRRQHWRFLVYVNYLISQGIAVAKKQEKIGFTRYQPPTRLLKLWMAKQKQAKRLEIAEKLAKFSHTSIKDSSKSMYLLKVACNNKDFLKNFSEQLKLNEMQVDWLKN